MVKEPGKWKQLKDNVIIEAYDCRTAVKSFMPALILSVKNYEICFIYLKKWVGYYDGWQASEA